MKTYTNEKLPRIKIPFDGVNLINRNYSQAYQDMFVLSMMDGKIGTYLEIGAYDPELKSNTLLLEQLGWTGFSIEINKIKWNRKNPIIIHDALTFNYQKGFYNQFHFNYLSIDIEPSYKTFFVLLKLLSLGYTFDIITFEHDEYNQKDYTGQSVKEVSRKILTEVFKYQLKVGDVCSTTKKPFEDWYVKPNQTTNKYPTIPNWGRLAERYILND
jgi:hypothetical protein